MQHHGMTFNFGSAQVFLPGMFDTFFSYDKDIWIVATDYYYVLLNKCDSYT